jgi:hypothetical protein
MWRVLVTMMLAGILLTAEAQNKNSRVSRSVDDDGKTMKVKFEVQSDSSSLGYSREFNVSGMSKQQKDEIVNRIVDSLGLSKSLKRSATNEVTSVATNSTASEKQLVANAVMDYVDAFYFGDTSKITRSISPNVVKYGYSRKKDERTYNGMAMSYQQMIDYVLRVKAKNDSANAQKLFKKVEVLDYLDQTASAKVTAWWGTDYILLAKQNGKWMITHVLWQSPEFKG